jgi:CBS-domain-containing membrane protein
MVALGVVHPPAGSNPIIIFLGQSNWGFLIFPTLTGVVVIVLVALVYNNLTRKTSYPIYW